MTALETAITELQARVAANTTVTGSASALIRGLALQLAAAIEAAKAAGATATQLAQLDALKAAMQTSDDDLAAAIAANTVTPVEQP